MINSEIINFILPSVVFLVICVLLIYFKRDVLRDDFVKFKDYIMSTISFSTNSREHFYQAPPAPNIKYNLMQIDNGVDIHGNLFIGYGNSSDQNVFKNLEDNKNAINEYILKNPENEQKFRNIDVNKRNIYINSGETVKHMCSGHEEDITKRQCLDKNLVDKYDSDKNKIPKFKNGTKHVYYNHDSKPSGHDELKIGDYSIDKTHLDMINGKMAITFNTKDDASQKGGEIKSYNVEYAERPGFANVVQKTFYMTDQDKGFLSKVLEKTKTCYANKKRHKVYKPYGKAGKYSGSFYMKPKPPKSDSYSHIHKHKDS